MTNEAVCQTSTDQYDSGASLSPLRILIFATSIFTEPKNNHIMTTYLITGTPPIDDFKPFTVPQGTFLAILAFLANELTVAVPLGTEEPKQPHETIISGNSLFCGLSVIIYRPYVP